MAQRSPAAQAYVGVRFCCRCRENKDRDIPRCAAVGRWIGYDISAPPDRRTKMRELLFSGELIDAARAKEIGLVVRLAAPDERDE